MAVLNLDRGSIKSQSGMANVYFNVWRMVPDFGKTTGWFYSELDS